MRCHSFCIAKLRLPFDSAQEAAQHELLQNHAPARRNSHVVRYICNLSEVIQCCMDFKLSKQQPLARGLGSKSSHVLLLPFQGVVMTDAYWFEALPKPVVLAGLSARQNQRYKSQKTGGIAQI